MPSNRKMYYIIGFYLLLILAVWVFLRPHRPAVISQTAASTIPAGFVASSSTLIGKTDVDWKVILTPEQYYILREKGTETPFSSPLDTETRAGTYYSAGCNEPLFRSEQKYDSGTGWPSFWAPISPDAVVLKEDKSLGITRTEVLDKCGGHLGHLFNDGPQPTGLRYCMNGEALIFMPDPEPNAATK